MKILVVDDARSVRERLVAMLRELRAVTVADDVAGADEALARLRTVPYDVVVLDLNMPTRSGLEIIPLIRTRTPRTIIIVLTNDATDHHRRECLARGADHFFDKSRDFGRIVDVLSRPTAEKREVLQTKGSSTYGAAEAPDVGSPSMNDRRLVLDNVIARMLLESSSDGIVILDDDGRLFTANAAARALSWSTLEPMLTSADTPDAELALFRARLRESGEATTELLLPVPPNGSPEPKTRHVLVRGKLDAGWQVLHLRDVSDRRVMEGALREARRLETLGHFTAALAHDFNNILTPIVCLSALLKERLDAESPLARLPSELEALARSGAALARQALAFTRGQSTPPQAVNLNVVVREMQVLLERLVGNGIGVDAWLDGSLGDAMVDRVQLEHVVLNLVANARDAMPHGGRLRLRTANIYVGDEPHDGGQVLPSGKYVMLSVTDDGVGMSPEVRRRAFDRYFTTKDAARGNGIGLANAQQFVSDAGGSISVRSEPGEGTSVTVYLPRHDAARVPTVPPPPMPRSEN